MATRKSGPGYRMRWFGDEVVDDYVRATGRNMDRAAQFLVGETKKAINRGQPSRRTASGSIVGLSPSAPGEPPKRLSHRLFQSIASEVEILRRRVIGRFGTNVVYGRRLELGFTGRDARGNIVDQAPRPYLRPQVIRHRKTILRILAQGF